MDNNNPQNSGADLNDSKIQWGGNASAPQSSDLENPNIQWGASTNNAPAPEGDNSLSSTVAHGVTHGAEGIGEGIFDTLGHVAKMGEQAATAGGLITNPQVEAGFKGLNDKLSELSGEGQPKTTGEQVGQGLESIGEFLLGDEALKGLSVADKLTQVSKAMKLIEGNGRLAKALALGINVGKAGVELGPEERAAIAKSPILARLVGVGMDALRQGTVQAAQTGLKTGNAKEAVKSGAEMAAGSAVLGVPLGVAGGVLAKGGEAAKTAQSLKDAAAIAPTSADVQSAFESNVNNAASPSLDAATQAKQEAEEKLTGASSAVEAAGYGAPTKQDIAAKAEAHMTGARNDIDSQYTQTIGKAKDMLEGSTIDYHDTPIKETVQELLGQAEKNKEYLPGKFKVPSPLTKNVQDWLQNNLEHFGEIAETGEDGKEKWIQQPTPVTADDLTDVAKQLKANIRKTSYSTPEGRADRDAYFGILDSVHQALSDLAEKSGKPEAYDLVQQANSEYKAGIERFQHPDVKALLSGDKESGIINYLTGGKSVGDIQEIKKTIGPKAFAGLADDAMARLAADSKDDTGQFNMQKWVRSMTAIPEDVRAEMFNDTKKSGALENILRQVQSVNGSGVVKNADKSISEAQSTIKDVLGNGKIDSLLKDPDRVQRLSQLIGPDAMGSLGASVLQNQLREAATDTYGKIGQVNVPKFIRFVESLKDSPEVVNALFKATPETEDAYAKLLSDTKNVDHAKNLIKYGVIAPTVGGVVAGGVGHSMFSALLGTLALEGFEGAHGYFSTASTLLDNIANHPAVWATLKGLNNTAESGAAKLGAGIAKAATGKYVAPKVLGGLKKAMQGTGGQLGGSFLDSAGASLGPGEDAINLSTAMSKEVRDLVDKYAKKYSLPNNLARAVIFHESAGNPKAVGKPRSDGQQAKGLGQLLPETAKQMGVLDPFNPEQNLDGAMKYLSRLYNKHDKNPLLAYAAYTSGPNRIKKGDSVQDVLKRLPPEGQKGVKKVAKLLGIDVNKSDKDPFMVYSNPKGLVEKGNIPIWNRPTVQNTDGSHSSEYSVSFQDDKGREVLVPTVVNGKFLTPDGKKPPEKSDAEKAMFKKAWQHYADTGENLGKFNNPDNADAYATILHNRGSKKGITGSW